MNDRYRHYAKLHIEFCCIGDKLVFYDDQTSWTKDAGTELGIEANVNWEDRKISGKSNQIRFGWIQSGTPSLFFELTGFQFVEQRPYKLKIWHKVRGRIWCENGLPTGDVNLEGSSFPSHTLFLNDDKITEEKQGDFSDLWAEHQSMKGFVK